MPSSLQWSLAHFDCASQQDFLRWEPSSSGNYALVDVPGAVQVSSYGMASPEILLRRNWEQVAWMEERLWVYRTELPGHAVPAGQCLVLRFRGLDYQARIFLDGTEIASHEGMFSPVEWEIDAESASRPHTVHVAFLPPGLLAAKNQNEGYDATGGNPGIPHVKARYMEGWDFTPRLRCVGIWDDVECFVASPVRIQTVAVQTRLDNVARAEVMVTVHLNRPLPQGTLQLELCGLTVETPVATQDRVTVVVAVINPRCWFPHSHGPATLHPLEVRLLDAAGTVLDTDRRAVGLREVRRRHAEGQRPTDTPAQFLLNGQPVFLQGANLTPFHSVPGLVTEEDYRRVLDPLRGAGVNFVRVWGGGVKEKDVFYRLCDEMGLLVMQEFPLACQRISREPRYLALLAREARAIVRALAAHPCVIWWTGGNEHYHFWEAMDSGTERMEAIKEKMRGVFGIAPDDRTWRGGEDPNHPALQMLHGIIQEELPSLPYNVTSGLEDEGETHGPWNLRLEIGDHRFRDFDFFDFWRQSRSALHSEASVAAAATAQTFARILRLPEDLRQAKVPIRRDDPDWVAHKAFGAAWDTHPDLWLDIAGTEEWFGPLDNLAELIFANHYLQCEATRYMIESVRRRQGESTGIIWWGANEPFPSLAGNALVGFFGDVKPALAVMGAGFAPQVLSLSYARCVARKLRGEMFFVNSLSADFLGSYRATVGLEGSGETIDEYSGNISAGPYAVMRLCSLTPTPLAVGEPLIVDVALFSERKEMVHSQRYRFFAEGPSPLKSLLTRSLENPAALFQSTI